MGAPVHRVNEQKYLVTWVEQVEATTDPEKSPPDFVRGQATKTIEEALRIYDHASGLETTVYCEVRMIGRLARHQVRTLQYVRPLQ